MRRWRLSYVRPTSNEHPYLYWEFRKGADQTLFSQSVRMGKWKAYLEQGMAMEIFDLDADPWEQTDLAESFPDMVKQMKAVIDEAHEPLPTAPAGAG